ncbi:MAG: biliverdin-producing heme oxygenase [Caulobacter sp.]|nr:biliverdin-producing heme oxygenase [Caulobacter sp.]
MTTPILDHLRATTRDLHDGLEARLDVFARVADPASRREMVGRFLAFYRPAEAALARTLGDEPDLDFDARRKVPALERDLETLDAEDRSDAPLAAPTGRSEALGFLYVLEGSTLGGRVIDRQLRLRGLSPEGLSFFEGYGEATGARWKAFCAVLERVDDKTAAARGARSAFAQMEAWMCGVAA